MFHLSHVRDAADGRRPQLPPRVLRFDAIEASLAAGKANAGNSASIAQLDLLHGTWDGPGRAEQTSTAAGLEEPSATPAALHHRPSSPVLGRRFGPTAETSHPTTGLATSRMTRADSTASLYAHYDPERSPLAVSQQTSASSSRDLALRKGCPTADGSRNDIRTLTQRSSPKRKKPLADTAPAEAREDEDWPLRLDISKLFPTPTPPSGPLLSPRRLTRSPSSVSVASERAQSPEPDEGRDPTTPSSVPATEKVPPRPARGSRSRVGPTRLSLEERDTLSSFPLPRKESIGSQSTQSRLLPAIAGFQRRPTLRSASQGSTTTDRSAESRRSARGSVGRGPRGSSQMSSPRSSTAPGSRQGPKVPRPNKEGALSRSDLLRQSILALSDSEEEDSSDDRSSGNTSLTAFDEEEFDAGDFIGDNQSMSIRHAAKSSDDLRSAYRSKESDHPPSDGQSSPARRLSDQSPLGSKRQSMVAMLPSNRVRPAEVTRPKTAGATLNRTSWLDVSTTGPTGRPKSWLQDIPQGPVTRPFTRGDGHGGEAEAGAMAGGPYHARSEPRPTSWRKEAAASTWQGRSSISSGRRRDVGPPSHGGTRHNGGRRTHGPHVSFILDDGASSVRSRLGNVRTSSAPANAVPRRARATEAGSAASGSRTRRAPLYPARRQSHRLLDEPNVRVPRSCERNPSRRRSASSGCIFLDDASSTASGSLVCVESAGAFSVTK